MNARIRKWGNSLGLRLPKYIADALSLREGSEVVLELEKDCLRLAPLREKRHELGELLKGVRAANLHGELGPAGPAGKEAF